MKLDIIDQSDYLKTFERSFTPFNTVEYNLLNCSKCDKIEFLLFHIDNHKIGIIGGILGNKFLSPFSAPFSTISANFQDVKVEYLIDALLLFDEYCISNSISEAKFIYPPFFYYMNLVPRIVYSMSVSNYSMILDYNHFFLTRDFIKYENNTIKKGLRYNLRVAEKYGLTCKKGNSIDELKTAFKVIEVSKNIKKYPLKMDLSDFINMKDLVNIDTFIVYLKDTPVAAAIVYNYSKSIVQIIYWGEKPEYKYCYPMNYLAMKIFKFYRDLKFDIVDLGNSSDNGFPNFGLFNFKENIGCSAALKYILFKSFNN